MNVNNVKNLANTCFRGLQYKIFIQNIDNNKLNFARIMVEDKIDELEDNNDIISSFQLEQAKQLDNIITNEIVNNIDDNRR